MSPPISVLNVWSRLKAIVFPVGSSKHSVSGHRHKPIGVVDTDIVVLCALLDGAFNAYLHSGVGVRHVRYKLPDDNLVL